MGMTEISRGERTTSVKNKKNIHVIQNDMLELRDIIVGCFGLQTRRIYTWKQSWNWQVPLLYTSSTNYEEKGFRNEFEKLHKLILFLRMNVGISCFYI